MVNLHEPQHTFMSPEINSPACPRRVCRLVGAILYPVAGRMTRCSEPARHTTSLLTQHQDRGVRRRRRSRHFYVTITRSCEYKCKKATVWPRYPESTSCQCWDPLITHSYKSDKCQVPVQWGLESPPAMPDTPQGTPVKCQEPGLWMCQKVYRYSRHCLTHHEETRQRMKASRDVLTSGWT